MSRLLHSRFELLTNVMSEALSFIYALRFLAEVFQFPKEHASMTKPNKTFVAQDIVLFSGTVRYDTQRPPFSHLLVSNHIEYRLESVFNSVRDSNSRNLSD